MLSNTLKLIDDKIGAIKLLLATCIGAIVELLSLGALLPAIFLIADRTDSKILISLKNFLFKLAFID